MARRGRLPALRGAFGPALPLMVAAMAFLAALAMGGAEGAASLARRWDSGAAQALTVLVPRPGAPAEAGGQTRRDAVLALVRAAPGLADVRALGDAAVADLVRPWLGAGAEGVSMPLPAVIAAHVVAGDADLPALRAALSRTAPGSTAEAHDAWVGRIATLARSVLRSALLVMLLVGAAAAGVVVLATRAALAASRESVEILHDLGATDGAIAGSFARRAGWRALAGGGLGALAAAPVLLALAVLAAPFTPGGAAASLHGAPSGPAGIRAVLAVLPPGLWGGLAALVPAAGVIGWAAARGCVRAWLRRLP